MHPFLFERVVYIGRRKEARKEWKRYLSVSQVGVIDESNQWSWIAFYIQVGGLVEVLRRVEGLLSDSDFDS